MAGVGKKTKIHHLNDGFNIYIGGPQRIRTFHLHNVNVAL